MGHAHLDLEQPDKVLEWLEQTRPDAIVLAAGPVGSVLDVKERPADILRANLAIQDAVIHGAHRCGVQELLFVASSAVYPNIADRPIQEDDLLRGPPDEASQWYALAKIAGLKLCEAYCRQYGRRYKTAILTNLYGPGDSFEGNRARVVASLIRRAYDARQHQAEYMEVWGTGTPCRDLLYVDDAADGLVAMLHPSAPDVVNFGSGDEIAIDSLARRICAIVGFEGDVRYLPDFPDGAPSKKLDIARSRTLGWAPAVDLAEGLRRTYAGFLDRLDTPGPVTVRSGN